ncbi:hypothetical protein [Caulobacter sp. NIBR2454]|uniref:hypothetical protein n=1 Tax=Caulobacter sp. NIBR2454 TaxID=3015996 RepID=UPI0022B6A7AA|nr:hypothetical protein [Caulobacter sp. NIBR2454]
MRDKEAHLITGGWLISVMTEGSDGKPLQRYFAVGHPDQAKAEWTCIDRATQDGPLASSPSAGREPVQAVNPINLYAMRTYGLANGEVKLLGEKPPRRWMTR